MATETLVDSGNPNPNPPSNPATPPVSGVEEGKGTPNPNPAPPAEKTYSFKEDRSDWTPRSRLNEESGKRTQAEQRALAAEQRAELQEKRLRIAMGLEVPNKEDAEANEVREALYKVNPKLRILDKLDEETIERILNSADSAESATRAQWERHKTGMLSDLTEEASGQLGVDKLSEPQTKRLHRAFREEAREQAQARAIAAQRQDSSYDFANDFVARYERGDKSLLKEFAKSFIEEWGIPVRRQANASALSRQSRPVPNGGRSRTPLTQGPPKIDYNDDKAFGAAMLSGRTGGGDV